MPINPKNITSYCKHKLVAEQFQALNFYFVNESVGGERAKFRLEKQHLFHLRGLTRNRDGEGFEASRCRERQNIDRNEE